MINQVNDKSAFLPFANSINDTGEQVRLLDQVATIGRFLFKGKEGAITQKASEYLPSDLASIFLELEEKGLEPAGDDRQMAFLDSLIKYLKAMPQVGVTLAFTPTNNFITRVNSVISNELGKKVVLDIIINQYIIGGANFEYKGKFREDNLGQKLDTVIVNLMK